MKVIAQWGKCLLFSSVLMIMQSVITQALPANNTLSCQEKFIEKPLSLPELTAIALSHNPQTQVLWAQVAAAAADVGIARSAYWPQLNAIFNVNKRFGNTFNNVESTKDVDQFIYGPNLTLNYLLLDFGTRAATVKSARFQWLASMFSRDETIQQIILAVNQAYYQLLAQQALVEAYVYNVKQAQESLASATALHHHGLATIGDVYQAKSALAEAELNLQQANGALASAKGQLATVIGVPVQSCLDIAKLPEHINTNIFTHHINELLHIAKKNRPDLLAAQAQVEQAEADLHAARSQFWPIVQISGNLGSTNIGTVTNTGIINNERQSNILLTIKWPIFSGFSQTNTVRKAQAEEEGAEAQQQVLENQIELQVWQAYFALQTAAKAIDTSEAFLQSSIRAAHQAYGQYKAGVGNILTVLTTQASEASARLQNVQAKLNWYVALAQLSAALGTLCP